VMGYVTECHRRVSDTVLQGFRIEGSTPGVDVFLSCLSIDKQLVIFFKFFLFSSSPILISPGESISPLVEYSDGERFPIDNSPIAAMGNKRSTL